jgi:hypothetical protein
MRQSDDLATSEDLETIRNLFSYGDDAINRGILKNWCKRHIIHRFRENKKIFLEIIDEEAREKGRQEDEHPSQFVLDQAAAAQQKRETRDQEEAAAAVGNFNLLKDTIPFMGVGGKKKYASKKRFSSRKIKSHHKHRIFRAKVKNSRRKSKKTRIDKYI